MGMVDVIIADIPENLPVPNVSDSTYSGPSWNAVDLDSLGEPFGFTDEILHDNEALILFHPDDNGDSRSLPCF